MPYTKKRKYKRRYRKKNNKSKKIDAVVMSKELNTHDYLFQANIDGISEAVIPLTQIAQGVQSLQRIGLKIKPVSLQYKLETLIDLSADTTVIRMIIFKDKQNNGTYPTVYDVLDNVTPTVMSWKEHDTKPRFHIYRDELIVMNNLTKPIEIIKGFIKFSNSTIIDYKGTSAAQTSNSKNAIFCLLITDIITTNLPYVHLETRLRYYD